MASLTTKGSLCLFSDPIRTLNRTFYLRRGCTGKGVVGSLPSALFAVAQIDPQSLRLLLSQNHTACVAVLSFCNGAAHIFLSSMQGFEEGGKGEEGGSRFFSHSCKEGGIHGRPGGAKLQLDICFQSPQLLLSEQRFSARKTGS